jgi:DNA-binding FrmR family transcriptional regulator
MNHEELIKNKQKSSLSIKKAQGTISKILQMIEDDKYCPDIIQQIDAVIGLLKSSKRTLLKGHLDHCLEDKLNENRKNAIEELIKILDLK